jgi:hypothetical protein
LRGIMGTSPEKRNAVSAWRLLTLALLLATPFPLMYTAAQPSYRLPPIPFLDRLLVRDSLEVWLFSAAFIAVLLYALARAGNQQRKSGPLARVPAAFLSTRRASPRFLSTGRPDAPPDSASGSASQSRRTKIVRLSSKFGRRACSWLLIGIAANLLVCWGYLGLLWMGLPYRPEEAAFAVYPGTDHLFFVDAHTGFERAGSYGPIGRRASTMPSNYLAHGTAPSWSVMRRSGGDDIVAEEAEGWPALCVYCLAYSDPASPDGERMRLVGSLKSHTTSVVERGWLPYLPIWRGWAINVPFYAAACFVAVHVPLSVMRAVGRARRHHRWYFGLCPKCSYDLLGDHAKGCPECGWGRL